MFAKSLKHVMKFTRPLIIAKKHYSGILEMGCATFFVVNREGWALTAWHNLEFAHDTGIDEREIKEFESKFAAIKDDHSLGSRRRKQKLAEISKHPDWVVDHCFWWGTKGVDTEENIYGSKISDVALVKLTNFDPGEYEAYPTFRDPSDDLVPGTSLCRLGYPFPSIDAIYDQQSQTIKAGEHTQVLPFPNEGMLTRLVLVKDDAKNEEARFIETSTPGLRGQSGGPVFDTAGNICGLQSRTINIPLGFSPEVNQNGKKVTEHQFLNVGHAAHVEEIVKILTYAKVSFQRIGLNKE